MQSAWSSKNDNSALLEVFQLLGNTGCGLCSHNFDIYADILHMYHNRDVNKEPRQSPESDLVTHTITMSQADVKKHEILRQLNKVKSCFGQHSAVKLNWNRNRLMVCDVANCASFDNLFVKQENKPASQ